jgi:hypothetical protein
MLKLHGKSFRLDAYMGNLCGYPLTELSHMCRDHVYQAIQTLGAEASLLGWHIQCTVLVSFRAGDLKWRMTSGVATRRHA